MKKAANNIFTGIRNMKFFKRTAISLALGFMATVLFSAIYESMYFWMAAHSGWVVLAGLIGSQVVLYKADFTKLVTNMSNKAMAFQQQSERQPAAESVVGNNSQPQKECTKSQPQTQTVDLEQATKELGDDFADADGESDADEDPEAFEDP